MLSPPVGPATLPVRVGRNAEYGRLVFDWPKKVGFTVSRDGQAVTIQFAAPAEVDLAALRRALPRQIDAAVVRPGKEGLQLGLVVPPDAQLRYFHSGPRVVFDVVTRIQTRAETEKATQAAAPPRPLARPKNEPGAAAPGGAEAGGEKPPPDRLVSVEASRLGADVTLKFNWRESVNAAVFRRGAVLWIVFDKPARLDLSAIRLAGRVLFETVRQEPVAGAAVLRLPMTMRYRAAVRRDGTTWEVGIGPTLKPGGADLPLRAEQRAGEGASVTIGMKDAAGVIALRDPDAGDTTFVVPGATAVGGVWNLRRFPEFGLLESAQGIAVRPLDERVRVGGDGNGARVFRPGGLTVSDPSVFAQAQTRKWTSKLLDFAAWQYGPAEDYQKIEHELLNYVTQPDGLKRSAARLGLARFYIAHGMAADSLGVVEAMVRHDAAMLRDPGVRALRGVGRYLVGHYAEAMGDFEHPALRDERQIDPWRAAIAAARGDWRRAHRLFEDADPVFTAYPTRFAMHFGLLATEAALSVGDLDVAAVRLSVLDATPATSSQLDHAAFLRGHLLKQQKETDKAVELWQAVVAMGDRPNRAKASFALVNTLLEQKRIKPGEAIEKLEQLRFAWRDDVFEFDLLSRLGQLYAETKDFRRSLTTLRRAATYFKEIEGAEALTEEMRALFRTFYLDGDADVLAPVVALGLFNEFRELTPPGGEGDIIYRKLADRLVAVDLLAEAAELLDHQVRFRAEGETRAQIGARLADVLLMSRKPKEALAALETSAVEPIPAALSDRRRRIAVRALSEDGRLPEALAMLDDDSSDEALLLRTQILWRSGDWPRAARALARLTGPFDEDKVDPREAELLLRRAVALSLAGDEAGIDYLRDRFGPAMAKTARTAEFAAVVGRKPTDTEDFAVLARQAAELDTFTAFMGDGAGRPPAAIPPQAAAIN
jgi:tetratricopeptide (TPR) repeat protein